MPRKNDYNRFFSKEKAFQFNLSFWDGSQMLAVGLGSPSVDLFLSLVIAPYFSQRNKCIRSIISTLSRFLEDSSFILQ